MALQDPESPTGKSAAKIILKHSKLSKKVGVPMGSV